MIPQPNSPTLDDVVPTLVDFFNRRFPDANGEDFQFPTYDRFELDDCADQAMIELPDNLSESAMQAIATLMEATGSTAARTSCGAPQEPLLGEPLRFSLMKRAAWIDGVGIWCRYLVIDHPGAELDVEAARRQIGLLVTNLEDPSNLIELDAEVRALF